MKKKKKYSLVKPQIDFLNEDKKFLIAFFKAKYLRQKKKLKKKEL